MQVTACCMLPSANSTKTPKPGYLPNTTLSSMVNRLNLPCPVETGRDFHFLVDVSKWPGTYGADS